MAIPARMNWTVIKHSLTASGVGIGGAFGAHLDVPVLVGVWVNLLGKLADQADVDLDKDAFMKIAAGVGTGVAGFVGGIKLANTYFAYTGVGTIPAMIINASANGLLTYVFGRSVSRVFLYKGSDLSVDVIIASVLSLILKSLGIAGGPEVEIDTTDDWNGPDEET